MSDWIGLPDNLNENEHFGIVYKIKNNITGRSYIGKKQLWSTIKRPPLKGKKRKRSVTKPSDYRSYYGSSEEFKKDVIKYGKDNFTREVLEITSCKWDAAYKELLWQIKLGVISSDDYYNGIINIRLPKMPLKLREKYKNVKIDINFN
jgi:hypothetical protein